MHAITALVSAAAVSLSALPPAHTAPASVPASSRAAVYGGFSSQDWPVVVVVSRDRQSITRAAIGGDLKCSSGGYISELDPYGRVPLSRRGAFRADFKDALLRWNDGSFDVYSGGLAGKANRAQTKMTGTWRLHDEAHDASGAVTDECDSGLVRWTAHR